MHWRRLRHPFLLLNKVLPRFTDNSPGDCQNSHLKTGNGEYDVNEENDVLDFLID